MAVPDFQSLMLPLLRMAADGREHPLAEGREVLAALFKLTSSEREELLPSLGWDTDGPQADDHLRRPAPAGEVSPAPHDGSRPMISARARYS